MAQISAEEHLERSRKHHRHDVQRHIVLPLIGGGAMIALLMAFVIVLPRAIQVSLVADFTLLLFVLCPLALCTLPFSIGLMVLAVMSGRLHRHAGKPLRRAEAFSVMAANRVSTWADRAARLSIAFHVRLTPVLQWMDNAFGSAEADARPNKDEDNHG
jgi:hypothetical protein